MTRLDATRVDHVEALRREAEWLGDRSSGATHSQHVHADHRYEKALRQAAPELLRLARIGLDAEDSGQGGDLDALERDLEVVRDYAVVELRDGDLLVVTVEARLSAQLMMRMKDELLSIARHTGKKNVKPVILDQCSLAVLRGAKE